MVVVVLWMVVAMKEKVKSAAAVVKKQLQSCCPYGRFMDPHGEVEDMEPGFQDTDASRVFDHGHLHCHAACLQNVVAVVANKSAARHPPSVLKITRGKSIASRPKGMQSATCNLYNFSPWSMVRPAKTPELQISSPLQTLSFRPPTKDFLELPIPHPVPTQAIRLESRQFVDSATTLSLDFSPKSNYSSQIHVQSQSQGESLTRAHQHPSAKRVYVPRGPLLHPSFEIVSIPALGSPGGTLTWSYCSPDLKSKLSRHVSGSELPSTRPAVPAPSSSPSTSGHGSKSRTQQQKIAAAASEHLHDTESQSPAARTSSKKMLHRFNKIPRLPMKRVAQTSLTGQLDRRGSRGSRESKIPKAFHSINLGYQHPESSVVSPTSEAGGPVQSESSHGPVTTTASGPVSNGLPTSDGQLHPENIAGVPTQSHSEEDLKAQAAVKVQAALKDYESGGSNHKSNAPGIPESSHRDEDPVRMLSQELKEVQSISTQMSRIEALPCVKKPQQQQRQPAAMGVVPASKGWNASIRTAQDCKVILRRRQEAAMKRERALQYALSRQHWKKSSKFQGPQWSTDDVGILDKPGWIWSWLERAARMGAHGSQNRIFDNDSFPRDPQSESLSVKSTVGMCTTEIGSCGNNNKLQEQIPVGWSSPDQWPLSLRQQHAAGLLLAHATTPREDKPGNPSRLSKPKRATAAGPPESSPTLVADREHIQKEKIHHHQCSTHKVDTVEEPDVLEKALSSTSKNEEDEGESTISPESNYGTSKSGHRVARKLEFEPGSLQQDQESVGSCTAGDQAPMPTSMTCRLTSHFAGGQRVRLQYGTGLTSCVNNNKRLSAVDSTDKAEIPQVQQGQLDDQISCAILEDDDDSVATTAASIRRPFWRP